VEANPALEQMVRGQDRTESLLILAAVLIYGLGVYLVTLLESHRTAGFLYRINRRMEEMCEGRYGGQVTPRKDDNFTYLAGSLNTLSRSLKTATEEDLAVLDEIRQAVDATAAGLGAAAGHTRERLLSLRGQLEALRRLKQSHLAEEGQTLPEGVAVVSDGAQMEREAPPGPVNP
jgi:hypothetical protein